MEKEHRSSLWALVGIVFFSTFATAMIATVLPAFFVQNLQLTYRQIGYIEGASAFAAFFSKFLSGLLSDHIPQRKSLIVWGTGLSLVSKGLFSLIFGFYSLLSIQIGDRLAKGLRSSPLDALIADKGSQNMNFFYHVKSSFVFLGSILGAGCSFFLLKSLHLSHFRIIFLLAMLPAFSAFFLSTKCLPNEATRAKSVKAKDEQAEREEHEERGEIKGQDVHNPHEELEESCEPVRSPFSNIFFGFLALIFCLMFSRFSLSFLGIKALKLGLAATEFPRLWVIYTCCSAGAALLMALFSNKSFKMSLLNLAFCCHFIGLILFFLAKEEKFITAGTVFCGLHLGFSQGFFLQIIARLTSPHYRGTAFAFYYLTFAVGLFLSNALAGYISDQLSPSWAFLSGAIFCLGTWSGFSLFRRKLSLSIDSPRNP
jgi:MFS family permease